MSRPDPAPKGSTEPATAQRPTRTRLAHFAIFNPSIPPPSRSARPTSETEPPDTLQHVDASHDYPARGTDGDTGDDQSGEHLEVDKDDLEQAAQIVFYTCPSDKNVKRDVMLRQVGLVRGLMAFTSAVAPGDETWWSVHSNNARMVVYIADGYHFYANLLNARGWSDRMVADLLKRAYEDFCLLHGSLPLIPTEKDRANIRIFYNSFSDTLDTSYLSLAASDRLSSWIGHTQSSHLYTSAVNGALDVFKDDINDTNDPDPRTGSTLSEIGILTPTQTYECSNPALERYLRSRLIAALPVPSPPRPIGSRRPAQRTREDTRKVSLGSWAWPFGSRPSTPAGDNAVHGRAGEQSLGGVPAGASGSARTSIDTSRGSLNGPATVSPQAAVVGVGAEQKSTWLGLGTVPSAIGGAVGSMGTIFGLRSHDAAKPSTIKASELFPEAAQPAGNEAGKPHFTPGAESASAGQAPGADDKTMRDTLDTQSIRSVLEPSVPLSELADAQTDQRSIAAQVDWEGRDFYLGENGWRRVEWTVREGILLFMVHPPSDKQGEEGSEEAARPPVADSHVLSLFNKLGSILSPEPTTKSTASSSSRHASGRYGPKPDSAIWPSEGMTHQVGEKGDMSLGVFADLRDTMLRHENVDEIYTRTSAPVPQKGNTASAPGLGSGNTPAGDAAKSAFVGVKRIEGGEVYLAVGKTDASLVDADNAMRNMLRSDPRVTA